MFIRITRKGERLLKDSSASADYTIHIDRLLLDFIKFAEGDERYMNVDYLLEEYASGGIEVRPRLRRLF